MKIFFDTEFTGLHKDTTLISIGLIADNDERFYAELTDYDMSQINDWVYQNVINNLRNPYSHNSSNYMEGGNDFENGNYTYVNGNKNFVGKLLLQWLEEFKSIEWVSDVSHYDFVLLIDLVYGHALNMPYNKHCSACHDINQDIAKYYNISEIEAFDKSRENILKDFNICIEGQKHNSLYDAKVIKAIYYGINNK